MSLVVQKSGVARSFPTVVWARGNRGLVALET